MLPRVRHLRLLGFSLDCCSLAPWSRRWAGVAPVEVEAKQLAASPWRWWLVLCYGRLLASMPLRLPEIA